MSTRDEDLTIEERQAEVVATRWIRPESVWADGNPRRWWVDRGAGPEVTGDHPPEGALREAASMKAPALPGMTLRQYAAIHLRVPDSGEEWLDAMIERARRDEFAGRALQGMLPVILPLSGRSRDDDADAAYELADAMLSAGGAS